MADGRVEYEIRGDMSNLDSDLEASKRKIVKSAEETAKEQEKSQKSVEDAVKKSNDNIAKDTQQTQDEIEKAVKSTNDAIESDSEKTYKSITDTAKDEGDKVVKSHKQASDEIADQSHKMGQDVENSFSTMAENAVSKIGKMVTAMAALKAAADTAKLAISEAVVNETAFAKVNTLLSDDTNTQAYYNSIKAASLKTGINFADYSESVYGAISASIDQNSAVDFVQTAVKLGKGGFTETATAVDVLTTAINAYSLEASEATRISDILITTQNLGKTTVDELASSMGQTIPIANNAGVAIDDLAAQYAIMTKNGVATAESGTQIKAMLNELSASGTKVSDTLKDISGKSFAELQAEGKNTAEILGMLGDHAEKSGVKLSDLFGSVEAGAAAVTLVKDGGEDFCNVLEQMGNAAGATEKAYETMANTTEERFNKLRNSLMLYVSDVGEKMLPAIEDFFDYLEEHSEEIEKVITGVGSVLSGLLKILIQAVEIAWKYKEAVVAVVAAMAAYKAAMAISNIVNSLKTALGAATIAQNAFNVAVSANPIGLIAAAIAAVIPSIMSLIDAYSQAGEAAESFAASVREIDKTAEDTIKTAEDEMTSLSLKVQRYDELRKAANLTAGEEAELKILAEELQTIFGNSATVVNSLTGEYNDLTAALENYSRQQVASVSLDAHKSQLADTLSLIDDLETKINETGRARDKALSDYISWTGGLADWGSFIVTDSYDNTIAEYERELEQARAKSIELQEQVKKDTEYMFDLIGNGAKETSDTVNGEIDKTKDNTEDLAAAYDNLESALTDIKTKYDLLNSAQDEFSNTGALSVSTLKSIISTYPELQDQVEKYLAGLIDERELLEAMTEAYDVDQQNYYKYLLAKQGYEEDFVNAAFKCEDSIVDYYVEKYNIDLRNYDTYLKAKDALQQKYYEAQAKYGDEIMEAFESGDVTHAKALIHKKDKELSALESAMNEVGQFYTSDYSAFQADFETIKERTYNTLNAGSSNSSGTSSKSSSGDKSSTSNKSTKEKTASGTSNNSGSSGGQTINITSYIPTVWDDAAKANEKLIAGGVAASLVGNSTSGKLISGLDSNSSAALQANAEVTDATLNDVVKAIKGLEDAAADMQVMVTTILQCDNVTLARQTIKGIKAIEKSTGKSPL